MTKEIEIPEGYEARIEGNKVIIDKKDSEDERIRSFLYEFIKICGWSEKQYPPREKCLSYLEKQKEQKSAEWSEEEKGILRNCISALQNSGNWFLANKLKLIRPQPHWKPSEEQMNALKVSSEYEPCMKNREHLKSLYNDLKKL